MNGRLILLHQNMIRLLQTEAFVLNKLSLNDNFDLTDQ